MILDGPQQPDGHEAELPACSVLLGTASVLELLATDANARSRSAERGAGGLEAQDNESVGPKEPPQRDLGRVWRVVEPETNDPTADRWVPAGSTTAAEDEHLVAVSSVRLAESASPAPQEPEVAPSVVAVPLSFAAPPSPAPQEQGTPHAAAAAAAGDVVSAGTGTGRRPRASLEDWGGGSLGDVLGAAARSRSSQQGQPVVDERPPISSRAMPNRPDVSAWGGGLAEVLAQRPPRFCRRPPMPAPGGESGTAAAAAASGGRRQRPDVTDWGGGLADVLLPPRHNASVASNSVPEASVRTPSSRRTRSPPPGVAEWGGGLADVLRPSPLRRGGATADEAEPGANWPQGSSAAHRSSSTAAEGRCGRCLTPREQPRRRARSVVVRKTNDEADCCPICLEAFVVRQTITELPCRHRFHVPCLRRYFSMVDTPTCPYCRSNCEGIVV
eukprot:gnl/TRDRNA2_/TRDRNA2_193817_c0_seq1.p1 gnl/TRDRNA2_/TRDRNA2_193817_c0~~gnl/TRDRNA2_/TRDRNA2_193817_c0_seq1.p1  ORF type:complete len:444 (-),score=51.64 gnl/TRDRNA2_/TRDRNA2_193817_c0_seq1:145-1476(-)